MKRYKANQNVEPGVYFCVHRLTFRSMEEEGPLRGSPGDVYRRVPAAAMLLVGPLLGLAFVIFLPVIGVVMAARVVVERLRERRGAPRAENRRPARGLPVHLTRHTRIHTPFEMTYGLARDPEHWDDWYVGLEEAASSAVTGDYYAVGMRFPLCGTKVDESVGPTSAHWRSEMGGPTETVQLADAGDALILSGIQDWTYEAVGDGTEVTVELDCFLPAGAATPGTILDLEAAGLEHSLVNLKHYCEHVH